METNTNENIQAGHTNKLFNLGVTNNIDATNVTARGRKAKDSTTNRDSIYNWSDREISQVKKEILKKGLRYGIRNKKINQLEILSRFEELAQALNDVDMVEGKDEIIADLNTKTMFFKDLQKLSTEFFDLCKKSTDNIGKEEHNALVNLSKEKNLVISKADKGAAVVIQNKVDYMSKMEKIISTPGKFRKLDSNETRKRETRLQNILRGLNSDVEKVDDLIALLVSESI